MAIRGTTTKGTRRTIEEFTVKFTKELFSQTEAISVSSLCATYQDALTIEFNIADMDTSISSKTLLFSDIIMSWIFGPATNGTFGIVLLAGEPPAFERNKFLYTLIGDSASRIATFESVHDFKACADPGWSGPVSQETVVMSLSPIITVENDEDLAIYTSTVRELRNRTTVFIGGMYGAVYRTVTPQQLKWPELMRFNSDYVTDRPYYTSAVTPMLTVSPYSHAFAYTTYCMELQLAEVCPDIVVTEIPVLIDDYVHLIDPAGTRTLPISLILDYSLLEEPGMVPKVNRPLEYDGDITYGEPRRPDTHASESSPMEENPVPEDAVPMSELACGPDPAGMPNITIHAKDCGNITINVYKK